MMADEVQSGLARSGRMLACDWEEVRPDVVVSSSFKVHPKISSSTQFGINLRRKSCNLDVMLPS